MIQPANLLSLISDLYGQVAELREVEQQQAGRLREALDRVSELEDQIAQGDPAGEGEPVAPS